MHSLGGKSDIFWIRILPKVIFLGLHKTKTMLMIVCDTKHHLTDISWFAGDIVRDISCSCTGF